jgi:hypothetical protein
MCHMAKISNLKKFEKKIKFQKKLGKKYEYFSYVAICHVAKIHVANYLRKAFC